MIQNIIVLLFIIIVPKHMHEFKHIIIAIKY